MNIHYFQRYHCKENVATGNAMLLLSRLYHYSPYKFNYLMTKLTASSFNDFNIGVSFNSQVKADITVPDGQIKQNSFDIVIETKLIKTFNIDQVVGHLSSFKNEDYQVMLTLSPYEMDSNQRDEIEEAVDKNNRLYNKVVKHIHLSFEELIKMIQGVIDENRDYELIDILEDYKEYCYHDRLISDRGNTIRAVTAGATFDENVTLGLYYDNADRGYSEHDYLALYKDKSILAVGKVTSIVEADIVDGNVLVKKSISVTEEQKMKILKTAESSNEHGWDTRSGHKFFFVDKFFRTNYLKTSKYPLQGTKLFKISEITDEKIQNVEELARMLDGKTW